MDFEIRKLEEAIVDVVNRFNVPMEAKKLVLENTLLKVTRVTDQQIEAEKKQLEEQRKASEADKKEEKHNDTTQKESEPDSGEGSGEDCS